MLQSRSANFISLLKFLHWGEQFDTFLLDLYMLKIDMEIAVHLASHINFKGILVFWGNMDF